MWTIEQINIQIERIREQQEQNGEKAAREASKRGEGGSLTEDGKIYRCRSFYSIFYLKKSYFKLFSKFVFVNSVKQVSANFLETAK